MASQDGKTVGLVLAKNNSFSLRHPFNKRYVYFI